MYVLCSCTSTKKEQLTNITEKRFKSMPTESAQVLSVSKKMKKIEIDQHFEGKDDESTEIMLNVKADISNNNTDPENYVHDDNIFPEDSYNSKEYIIPTVKLKPVVSKDKHVVEKQTLLTVKKHNDKVPEVDEDDFIKENIGVKINSKLYEIFYTVLVESSHKTLLYSIWPAQNNFSIYLNTAVNANKNNFNSYLNTAVNANKLIDELLDREFQDISKLKNLGLLIDELIPNTVLLQELKSSEKKVFPHCIGYSDVEYANALMDEVICDEGSPPLLFNEKKVI